MTDPSNETTDLLARLATSSPGPVPIDPDVETEGEYPTEPQSGELPEDRALRLAEYQNRELNIISRQTADLRDRFEFADREARNAQARLTARIVSVSGPDLSMCEWPTANEQWAPSEFGVGPVALCKLPIPFDQRYIDDEELAEFVATLKTYPNLERIMIDHEGEWLQAIHGRRGQDWQTDALVILDRVVNEIAEVWGWPNQGGPVVGFYNLPWSGGGFSDTEQQLARDHAYAHEAMKRLGMGITNAYATTIDRDIDEMDWRLRSAMDASCGLPFVPIVCPHCNHMQLSDEDAIIWVRETWLPALLPVFEALRTQSNARIAGYLTWYNQKRLPGGTDDLDAWHDQWRQLLSEGVPEQPPSTGPSDPEGPTTSPRPGA